MRPELILASSSPHRRALLARLGLPFAALAPAIDERPLAGERPAETAVRLAEAKAAAIAGRHPDRLVIGCDQVGEVEGRILGKPGSVEEAAAQLARMAGREIRFHTALCVLHRERGLVERAVDCTEVRMRALGEEEIRRYLAAEEVIGCAGSFRVEGLGIALLEEVRSRDPSALIGLPLIALARILRRAGIPLP